MTDDRMSFTNNLTMYNIITKQKNNKTLYTVVFVTHQLSLPFCQSYDYNKCVDYITNKELESNIKRTNFDFIP